MIIHFCPAAGGGGAKITETGRALIFCIDFTFIIIYFMMGINNF